MLSSKIIYNYFLQNTIDCHYIDAADVIAVSPQFSDGEPDLEKTIKNIQNKIFNSKSKIENNQIDKKMKGSIYVLPGFFGATNDGDIVTMGRNGSDLTAILAAKAIESKSAVIWRETDGIMAIDPKIVPHSPNVEELSLSEAYKLGYYGCPVLHRNASGLIKDSDLQIKICNINKPESRGTNISSKTTNVTKCFKVFSAQNDIVDFSIDFAISQHRIADVLHFLECVGEQSIETFRTNIECYSTGIKVGIFLKMQQYAQFKAFAENYLQSKKAVDRNKITISGQIVCLLSIIGNYGSESMLYFSIMLSALKKANCHCLDIVEVSPHSFVVTTENNLTDQKLSEIYHEVFGSSQLKMVG